MQKELLRGQPLHHKQKAKFTIDKFKKKILSETHSATLCGGGRVRFGEPNGDDGLRTPPIELGPQCSRSLCSAKIFQVSKCSVCSHPLELPSVHFLCQHSYHQQ